jgi:peptidoglycan/xylan/chitin deacetylase (PgdA/CDA1 family)
MYIPEFFFQCAPLAIARRICPRNLTAFFYHAVSVRQTPHISNLYTVKSLATFEKDLAFLKNNFSLLSYTEFLSGLQNGGDFPKNSALISFDDGFQECFTNVRPLLRKYEVPAIFFVCPGFIGNKGLMYRNVVSLCLQRLSDCTETERDRLLVVAEKLLSCRLKNIAALKRRITRLGFKDQERILELSRALSIDVEDFLRNQRPYLDEQQLEELHLEGFTIGAHSMEHPNFEELGDLELVERQIVDSCRWVKDLLSIDPVPFAIPFNGLRLPRAFLNQVREKYPFVGPIFDTNDLMYDHPSVFNRISADSPRGETQQRSSLEFAYKRAHLLEPLRLARRALQGLPH